jgi:hypothetical protein
VTASGNARISTAQSKFGGASGLFGGAGYLSTSDSTDWNFGTGDFTIDLWVRFSGFPSSGYYYTLVSQDDNIANSWALNLYNTGGKYQWFWYTYAGGSRVIDIKTDTMPLAANTWYHVALVRSGSSWLVFQDGAQCGATVADTHQVIDVSAPLRVGTNSPQSWGGFLNGYIDELRISKGVARWTSNFTPPASAYASDGYTVLLLHMDGADASTTFIDDVTTG